MHKPFDSTLGTLIELQPDQWARCFSQLAGIPFASCVALDTDLGTTVQADKVYRIDGPQPSLLHLELEANPRTGIPRELSRYNTLVDLQHDLPVETMLILLRRKALASDQTGTYERFGVNGNLIARFQYRVVRVWEQSLEFWFNNGFALAPLGLLTDEAAADLEAALRRFRDYLAAQRLNETTRKSILGSSYVLCGLRYVREQVAEMYRRLSMLMEDSTTYQEIFEKGEVHGMAKGVTKGKIEGRIEGRIEGKHETLIRLGTIRFGPPSDVTTNRITQITNTVVIDQLLDRVLIANNWDDLLSIVAQPPI